MNYMKSIKLYLKDKDSGEISIKYICKDCGLEMEEPKNYLIKCKGGIPDPFTAEFRCDNCYGKFIEKYKNKPKKVVIKNKPLITREEY